MSITVSEILSLFTLGLSVGVTAFVILTLRGVVKESRGNPSEDRFLDVQGLVDEFRERLGRLEERVVDQSVKLELAELKRQRRVDREETDYSMVDRAKKEEREKTKLDIVGRPFAEGSKEGTIEGTEARVLRLVVAKGSVSGPTVEREITKSREHTARLLNSLFSRGLLTRDATSRPYRYGITEKGREVARMGVQGG